MTPLQFRTALLYCSLINYAVLILWVLIYLAPFRQIREWASRLYRVTPQQFDAINLGGIVFYKVTIIVFNIIPFVVLWLFQ